MERRTRGEDTPGKGDDGNQFTLVMADAGAGGRLRLTAGECY